ncbi:MAG: glycoside hydrolase family 31 protein [Ruminococcaceae bacterium]|nr:glycoside hydrolase family 31 protein [Oscillospiraceae bacterium]
MTEITRLSENIYRIRHWQGRMPRESLLSKYKIINLMPDGVPAETLSSSETNTAVLKRGYSLSFTLSADEDGGFSIKLPLTPADRMFGLGDESRDSLEKHGKIAVMKQANVTSYGPVPYLMSSRGWAVLLNCTYAHTFDIAATTPDLLQISCNKGSLDLIVFCGKDLHEALYLSGKVMGRPVMLPKGAYGLTFVLNEETTARTLLDDSLRFKEREIPCDILGLEPSWMSKHYDSTTEKKWNSDRFPIPYWQPENYYGSWSFIWNLKQMGRMLSLWLCCDYDLFWKEEGDSYADETNDNPNAVINDAHLNQGVRMDKVTKAGEPWFEHLKKFVDNGAEAFKLDGSSQVIPFPDRLWAGRYTDDEIRNLYPVVYAKQMKEGYAEYTGRRAMIYTCGTYPGTQKYAATWAGDTGCDSAVLLSLMNFAMCGHSNASFDMECDDKQKIHFGFLAPWSQHLGWANWQFPWYCGDEAEECYRWYAQLRSRLFPYLYAYAHIANTTSLPMLRPLSLQYFHTDRYDSIVNEYMLGDSFLVSVFDDHITLPEEDEWFDFFTGKKYTGPKQFIDTPTGIRGGSLFVRAGSIVVMQDWAHSLRDYRPNTLYVHIYPGKDTSFTLYEDDYATYGYEKGEYAQTLMTLEDNVLTIHPREGTYPDMPKAVDYHILWHHDDGSVTETAVENRGETITLKD